MAPRFIYFFIPVAGRRRATLEPLIHQNILPGTRVISDGWLAYSQIEQIGGGVYTHDVVIHDDNFVDPADSNIHTLLIESLWKNKKKLRNQSRTS